MEVDAYVQARYGRLLEHAVELGAPEGQAAAYVDEVLLEHRRRIRRSADPDPMVREALARAIRGEREHSRAWIPIAVVLTVVAVLGLAGILVDPATRAVPSLLGYEGPEAEARLAEAGWDVQVRLSRTCEPQDLVVGTEPPAGSLLAEGAPITLRTAVPDTDCPPDLVQRAQAWQLVRFARDLGPAPAFAATVGLVVDGDPEISLSREQAGRPQSWAGALDLVEDAAEQTPATASGMPDLVVTQGTPPPTTCATDRPATAGERESLRLTLETGAECPVTVDLYLTAAGIDAVVVCSR